MPDELYIYKEEVSNRCLLRDGSEKWDGDIDGKPGPEWVRIIKYSAYQALQARVEELERENAIHKSKQTQYESTVLATVKRRDEAEFQLAALEASNRGLVEAINRLGGYIDCCWAKLKAPERYMVDEARELFAQHRKDKV